MVKSPAKLTFEEWLTYDDGTDIPHALVDGRLVPMPPESSRNIWIAEWLQFQIILRGGIQQPLVTSKCWIQVSPLQVSPHEEYKTQSRIPDLMVLKQAHLELLTGRPMCITLDMPPPDLVVEVVSPGTQNRERDYDAKFRQYCDRGIPEYWLIDPDAQTITICKLVETGEVGKVYNLVQFTQDAELISDVLPELDLTVAVILARGER
ncbi:Uma2 family endonuclease [bacterium]|nr:Uma2 family endonuclease [bacterium]